MQAYRIAPSVLVALEADLRRRTHAMAPEEACGLLFGSSAATGLQLRSYRALPNRAAAPRTAFRIDALDFLHALDSAVPERCVGVFHSHPSGTLRPSAADLAACWPEHVLVLGAGRKDGDGIDLRVFTAAGVELDHLRTEACRTPSE